MNTTTKSTLTPETDAERNVRILRNRATEARNAATAAEDTDAFEALDEAANEAQAAWMAANRALVLSQAK
jgi:hypothetical protein